MNTDEQHIFARAIQLKAERDALKASLAEILELTTWLVKHAPGNYWIDWPRSIELEARVERAEAILGEVQP